MSLEEFKQSFLPQINRVIEWNELAGNVGTNMIPIYNQLCDEEMAELSEAIENAHDIEAIVKEACDQLVVECYLAHLYYEDSFESIPQYVWGNLWLLQRLGVDMLGAFKAVVDSNWSKYSSASELKFEDIEQHTLDLEADGRYTGVHVEVKDGFVIFRSDAGKLLKGPEYKEPDLKPFLPDCVFEYDK